MGQTRLVHYWIAAVLETNRRNTRMCIMRLAWNDGVELSDVSATDFQHSRGPELVADFQTVRAWKCRTGWNTGAEPREAPLKAPFPP